MLVKFKTLQSNPYWDILKSAQDLHVKARDEHENLLAICKEKGVKFSDLKSHMLNEAKKIGLYSKTGYDDKTGQMVYPAFRKVIATSWGNALHCFLSYCRKYSDYGIEISRLPKKNTVIRRKAVVPAYVETQTQDAQGNWNSVDENDNDDEPANSTPSGYEVTERGTLRPLAPASNTPDDDLSINVTPVAPIGLESIKRLVAVNLNSLEALATEKGIHDEFLDIMKKMGLIN